MPLRPSEPDRRRAFGGHLVLAGDGWFADLTAPQFHRPQLGIIVTGAFCGPYDKDLVASEIRLLRGGLMRWVWRPEVRAYRTVPAWRQDTSPGEIAGTIQRVRGVLARSARVDAGGRPSG